MQYTLKQYSLARIVLVAKCCSNALQDKLRGSINGHRQTVALHQSACNNTGESISRARIMCRQVGACYFPVVPTLATVSKDRGFTGIACYRHSGHDHRIGPIFRSASSCLQSTPAAHRAYRASNKALSNWALPHRPCGLKNAFCQPFLHQ